MAGQKQSKKRLKDQRQNVRTEMKKTRRQLDETTRPARLSAERLKELTRGKKVAPEGMREFISGLGMPDDVEARLLALTPATYTGLAAELVSHLDD